ncbi:MAG: GNAT family N-acetyltransferase [Rhizobiales bacterium]|nr:GNAT family N-acetyltransferase [Hyphomicrobiales bacterium]MBI3673278.1 GNAT family N-acetyltransferase [Hyphomicrobiales bacterium]
MTIPSSSEASQASPAGDLQAVPNVSMPVAEQMWNAVYQTDDQAMPTQSPKWAEAVARIGRFRDVSRLYDFGGGQRAVLPMFAGQMPGARWSRQFSPPAAWGFGGPIASRPLSAAQLRSILEDVAALPALSTQIRPNPLDAGLWREAAPRGWTAIARTAHVLSLEGGFDKVFASRFKSDTRNRIRRAERAGLEIVSGNSTDLVGEFHALLRRSILRWGRRQGEPAPLARFRGNLRDPQSKFVGLAAVAQPLFRLWIARLAGKPVAAILVLRDRQAHYTRGAMDETVAGETYANYLLHHAAIKDACEHGCRHYHMGETGNSASLAQFKSRFGAVAVPYAEYRHERLPISALQDKAKSMVKRMIGFRDV